MKVVFLGHRSYFSLGRGLYSPEDWALRAGALGAPAAGMADRNNLYGMVRWIQACARQGVKPVVGALLVQGAWSLWAWCLDRRGLGRLCRIITQILEQERLGAGDYDLVRDLEQGGWGGLALGSADPGVLRRLASRDREELYGVLEWTRPFFPLRDVCRSLGVKTLALGAPAAQNPGDGEFYRLLRAMDLHVTVEELSPQEVLLPGDFLPDPGAWEGFYQTQPEALDSLAGLVHRARTDELLSPHFVFPAFQGLSEIQAAQRLQELCRQGIQRRYPTGDLAAVQARLEYELQIIQVKGFSTYFLVVQDVVSRFPRTCGRGSGAASLVSYLLGITHVDPLRYNLFFERFLNMGRQDPPDIDVDFPWDERAQALEYVFKTYPGQAAMVADHCTFARRSLIRDPAKALGQSEEEIRRLLDLWEHRRYSELPEHLWTLARRLKGFPRYLGTHPGGVVITPGPILDYTHVQTSPLGWPVIAWEKDAAEDAGLVKIDLLGNRSLAVLRDCMAALNPHLPEPLDWESFQPYEDPQTIQQIESGDTLGVFYVESPATRLLLRRMGRGDFEHLVVASSIIRPAANHYIGAYVDRLHGASWEPVDPDMEKVLRDTLGIMVYQEDVSRVAMAVAGFDAAEADLLRKILSKKDRALRLEALKSRFFEKAAARGRSGKVLEKIWSMILSFEGYSFCKPHSASYALVSMRLAYIKRHHPLMFYTCVINNGGGFYGLQTYLNAVRRLGIPLGLPDVNASDWAFRIEGPPTGLNPRTQVLRVGLAQIRDLEEGFLQQILRLRRQDGPFADLEDFLRRLSPAWAQIRILIRSGGLDSLAPGRTRPQLFWIFQHTPRGSLFPGLPPPPAVIRDYSPGRKLQDEVDTLGLIYSRFPLDLFEARAQKLASQGYPRVTSVQLPQLVGRRVTVLGLFVTCKPVGTQDKKEMAFVSLEDRQGMVECVAFPPVWAQVSEALGLGWVFLAQGLVTMDHGACMLELESLSCLNRPASAGVFYPGLQSRGA